MSRFLIGLSFLPFAFCLAATVFAQQYAKASNEQTASEEKAGVAESKQRTKGTDQPLHGFSPLAVKDPKVTAKPVDANPSNSTKEKILGMDSTIALVVVFSVFLVLVTVIIAASGNRDPKD